MTRRKIDGHTIQYTLEICVVFLKLNTRARENPVSLEEKCRSRRRATRIGVHNFEHLVHASEGDVQVRDMIEACRMNLLVHT